MQSSGEHINSAATRKPTAGVILAAGVSSRLGRPKQLLKLKNKYLIEWVLAAALKSRLQTVILVLGHEHQKILRALGDLRDNSRLEVVINDRYLEGQSGSLIAGLSRVRNTFSSVMFLLGDQPILTSEIIDRLLDAFWKSEKDICVPVCQGNTGNPTIFGREMYDRLLAIKGDIGARDIIRANPARIVHVEVDDPLCFFDIDSENDFTHLKALLE